MRTLTKNWQFGFAFRIFWHLVKCAFQKQEKPKNIYSAQMAATDVKNKKRELAGLIEGKDLYDKAKAGDDPAIKRILYNNRDGEYEGFRIEQVR